MKSRATPFFPYLFLFLFNKINNLVTGLSIVGFDFRKTLFKQIYHYRGEYTIHYINDIVNQKCK